MINGHLPVRLIKPPVRDEVYVCKFTVKVKLCIGVNLDYVIDLLHNISTPRIPLLKVIEIERAEVIVVEPVKVLYAFSQPLPLHEVHKDQPVGVIVEKIIEAIRDGRLPDVKLVYRPVVKDADDLGAILKRFADRELIEIQVPQAACIGVNEALAGSVRSQIVEYLDQITVADLLVMSSATSMMFDALHFDIPCIANFTDPTRMLDETGFSDDSLWVKEDGTFRGTDGIPVVYSYDELIVRMQAALSARDAAAQMKEKTFSIWDYQNKDYVNGFIQLIEEMRPSSNYGH